MFKEINIKEADEAGLTIIRNADKSYGVNYANYKLYKFNKCQHEQFCQPSHVRRKNIKCNTCFDSDIKDALNSFEFEYISHNGNSNYRVKAKNCLHEFDMYLTTIRKRKTGFCPVCYDAKIKKEALQQGMEVIGLTETKYAQNRKYKFIECGHTIDTTPEAIRDGRFECKACIAEEYADKVAQQGLVVLDKKAISAYRWFKLPCGCDKEVRMEHAKNGNWACHNCGDNQYNKPSKIYLVKYESPEMSWLKMGYAHNLLNRFSNYGVSSNYKRELLFSRDMTTGYSALLCEKEIHSEFKHQRLPSQIMKNYHRFNGFTECYPISLQEDILKRMEMINE